MLAALSAMVLVGAQQSPLWLRIEGGGGPGKGKEIVLLAGDEEYRSEESLPQLAKILAKHHGFNCTVLFSINERGEIDPDCQTHQPGTHWIAKAELVIMGLRFRHWPDSQMKPFAEYVEAGKPIIGIRTSTHAFAYPKGTASPYAKYSWDSKEWPGGFGKQILGETWVSHWGRHGVQGTRGIAAGKTSLLNGVADVFCETDVYEAHPPHDAKVILRGQVTLSLDPSSGAATGEKQTAHGPMQPLNDPMMPLVWTREAQGRRVVTSTMGSARDFLNEGFRRLIVNSAYWSLKLPVPKKANVNLVPPYEPSAFGFGRYKPGVLPSKLPGAELMSDVQAD